MCAVRPLQDTEAAHPLDIGTEVPAAATPGREPASILLHDQYLATLSATNLVGNWRGVLPWAWSGRLPRGDGYNAIPCVKIVQKDDRRLNLIAGCSHTFQSHARNTLAPVLASNNAAHHGQAKLQGMQTPDRPPFPIQNPASQSTPGPPWRPVGSKTWTTGRKSDRLKLLGQLKEPTLDKGVNFAAPEHW